MNISDILNPATTTTITATATPGNLASPPLSPKSINSNLPPVVHGKPRSRFSELEDAIICQGVAKGLTWGQISRQLPHRKRATCFNRYRTLQGIRKSRKQSFTTLPPSPESTVRNSPSPPPSSTWLPSSPRSPRQLPSPRQLLLNEEHQSSICQFIRLPPLLSTHQHA
ncbi:hypothetical protein VTP01DRAFT_2086 [Rhizomucor pusillus]|uniref:uncharacterized protein n=1 Tax=Rhizomucor pusillus TaxID=4840 RepID=UPI0037445B40